MKKRDLVAAGTAAILATFGLAQAGATGPSPVRPEPAAPLQVVPAQVMASTAPVTAPAEAGFAEGRRVVRVVYPSPYQR